MFRLGEEGEREMVSGWLGRSEKGGFRVDVTLGHCVSDIVEIQHLGISALIFLKGVTRPYNLPKNKK